MSCVSSGPAGLPGVRAAGFVQRPTSAPGERNWGLPGLPAGTNHFLSRSLAAPSPAGAQAPSSALGPSWAARGRGLGTAVGAACLSFPASRRAMRAGPGRLCRPCPGHRAHVRRHLGPTPQAGGRGDPSSLPRYLGAPGGSRGARGGLALSPCSAAAHRLCRHLHCGLQRKLPEPRCGGGRVLLGTVSGAAHPPWPTRGRPTRLRARARAGGQAEALSTPEGSTAGTPVPRGLRSTLAGA